ncbi:hypothetical protein [Streptomyces sp. NRRL F-5123]|uniref:hypothetical protein n=1 Tax=Streptomyces sp. NRRL F-5123 TaxID=1463856 RepID=UPI0004E1990F|nr:hypothetical protein [Streptomyces sp. NRRL F-5123]
MRPPVRSLRDIGHLPFLAEDDVLGQEDFGLEHFSIQRGIDRDNKSTGAGSRRRTRGPTGR